MSGMQKPGGLRGLPVLRGGDADVPHETQEACIAALHTEIGRMRGILATLRPTGVTRPTEDPDELRRRERPPGARLTRPGDRAPA